MGADRVHPIPEGHELMARLFLRGQRFDVTVPDTWEELHALAGRPHDEWENRRYQLETDALSNIYVEWCVGFGVKSREAIATLIEGSLITEQRPVIRQRLENYLSNRDLIPGYREALIEHTNTMGKD